MSSYEVNTVELSLQGTPTKTVTLAPERATIVRELADVPIKVSQYPLVNIDSSCCRPMRY